MAQGGSNRKVANSLVAAGTAAVMAVYAAGYARTRAAASQLDAQTAERRPVAAAEGGGRAARGPAPSLAPGTAPSAVPSESPALVREEGNAPVQVAKLMPPPATLTPGSTSSTPVPEQKTEAPVTPSSPVPVPAAPAPAPVETTPAPAPVAAVVSAPAPVAAAPAAPAAAKWKDGTYKGWGTCRHGDIEAQVVIEGGRITSATIAQCLTRYSCDIIGRLPPQVVQRQSAEVDYVTGATQSANAFYYALVEALGKAK